MGEYLNEENLYLINIAMHGSVKMGESIAETVLEVYQKYIAYYKKGIKLLYMMLSKTLYELFKIAMMFYLKQCKVLKNM